MSDLFFPLLIIRQWFSFLFSRHADILRGNKELRKFLEEEPRKITLDGGNLTANDQDTDGGSSDSSSTGTVENHDLSSTSTSDYSSSAVLEEEDRSKRGLDYYLKNMFKGKYEEAPEGVKCVFELIYVDMASTMTKYASNKLKTGAGIDLGHYLQSYTASDAALVVQILRVHKELLVKESTKPATNTKKAGRQSGKRSLDSNWEIFNDYLTEEVHRRKILANRKDKEGYDENLRGWYEQIGAIFEERANTIAEKSGKDASGATTVGTSSAHDGANEDNVLTEGQRKTKRTKVMADLKDLGSLTYCFD